MQFRCESLSECNSPRFYQLLKRMTRMLELLCKKFLCMMCKTFRQLPRQQLHEKPFIQGWDKDKTKHWVSLKGWYIHKQLRNQKVKIERVILKIRNIWVLVTEKTSLPTYLKYPRLLVNWIISLLVKKKETRLNAYELFPRYKVCKMIQSQEQQQPKRHKYLCYNKNKPARTSLVFSQRCIRKQKTDHFQNLLFLQWLKVKICKV